MKISIDDYRKKTWARHLRICGINFYVSNIRMKKARYRDVECRGWIQMHVIENKRKLYDRQCGCCAHCGQPFDFHQMEFHHVLPLARFPELVQSIRNGILLCHNCHREVHLNPFLNIRMMQEKAAEMGFNLEERYNIPDSSV